MMYFKMKKTSITLLCLLTVGCSKIQSITQPTVECNSPETKALIKETLLKNLTDQAINEQKRLINSEQITLDTAKIRQNIKNTSIQIEDVRTDKSDPDSKKQYCTTHVSFEIPNALIQTVDSHAQSIGEKTTNDRAVLNDITLQGNTLSQDIHYTAQPTDDGKKLYINLSDNEKIVALIQNITTEALALPLRQLAQSAQEDAEARADEAAQEEQQQSEAEYAQLQLENARMNIAKANSNLNLVWNNTTADIRNSLLNEQRLWLKQRKIECQLKGNEATDASQKELTRLTCETDMTNARVTQLKETIYRLEADAQ